MINMFFFLMILAELVAASSQMLLKKSAGKEYPSFIREYLNVLVISGYGLLVVSMIITIVCYGSRILLYGGTVPVAGSAQLKPAPRFTMRKEDDRGV